jgi:hypothetical protein
MLVFKIGSAHNDVLGGDNIKSAADCVCEAGSGNSVETVRLLNDKVANSSESFAIKSVATVGENESWAHEVGIFREVKGRDE